DRPVPAEPGPAPQSARWLEVGNSKNPRKLHRAKNIKRVILVAEFIGDRYSVIVDDEVCRDEVSIRWGFNTME
ncbi:MAG: hypothetical protein Q9175_006459, partial [Cornicularia normoerica]